MMSSQTVRWWKMRLISVEGTCFKQLIKDMWKIKNDRGVKD